MTDQQTPAGWYPDPENAGQQRYWDGQAWTEHRHPNAPAGQSLSGSAPVTEPTSQTPPGQAATGQTAAGQPAAGQETPAGWYPDPENAGQQRYWDGQAWTEHRHSPAPSGAPQPAASPQGASSGNGMATAALVLGIVGILLAWIPIIGFLGMLCGVLAVVFGLVGRRKYTSGEATTGNGAAITGVITGGIAVAMGIVVLVILGIFVESVGSNLDELDRRIQEQLDEMEP